MMAEIAASLPSAGFGAVAAIAIRAIVQAFKINKDADGNSLKINKEAQAGRDSLQALRISELERRMDENDRDCHAKLDAMNSRLNVIAQVTVHVTAELRVHAPESPTLDWAKAALQRAFPLDLNTPPDMVKKARKLGDEA